MTSEPLIGQDIDWVTLLGLTGDNVTGYWADEVATVSLGTATGKTLLGGSHIEGTSFNYQIPTDARALVAVRPKLYSTTPTANQAVVATLKVESADLHIGDFEVFANPLDSGLGTNEMQILEKSHWYPINYPCNGSELVQFYGTAQIANTVAPLMGVDVLLSDEPPSGPIVQAKVTGINYSGGPTSTGTAAATFVVDGGIIIAAPQKLIKAVYGVVVGTTPAASKPIGGQFNVSAGELNINPLRWQAEPITGFLGTSTTGALAHLSLYEGLNIRLRSPSRVVGSFELDTAITTAGNFEVGYLYVDSP